MNSETLAAVATHAVFVGGNLPAHDEVFDLAERVGVTLGEIHSYIQRVRSTDQADKAVRELLDALRTS